MPENQPANPEKEAWRDRHGDVWTLGIDGLMHTPETRPFPLAHVQRKWGPLTRVIPPGLSTTAQEGEGRG